MTHTTFVTVTRGGPDFDIHNVQDVWQALLGCKIKLSEVALPEDFCAYTQVIRVMSDCSITIRNLEGLLNHFGHDFAHVGLSSSFATNYPHLFKETSNDRPILLAVGPVPYAVP